MFVPPSSCSELWSDHLTWLVLLFTALTGRSDPSIVLDNLHLAGLTMNPSKCMVAAAETEYLDRITDHCGLMTLMAVIKPQINKIQATESCPLPQTRNVTLSLGLVGFYHQDEILLPQFHPEDRGSSPCFMTSNSHYISNLFYIVTTLMKRSYDRVLWISELSVRGCHIVA